MTGAGSLCRAVAFSCQSVEIFNLFIFSQLCTIFVGSNTMTYNAFSWMLNPAQSISLTLTNSGIVVVFSHFYC